MTEEVSYKCANCGKCCNRLLIDRQGVRKGLPLLPNEIELFKPVNIIPAIALGDNVNSLEILMYQMTLNSCPHWMHGGCGIWVYRPTICRAYPVLPVMTTGNRVVLSYDLECTSLKRYQGIYKGSKIPWKYESISREAKNARKLSLVTLKALEEHERAWFYDLTSKDWVPFSKLLRS